MKRIVKSLDCTDNYDSADTIESGTALVVCAVLNRCEQQTKVLDYIMMIAM